MTARFKVRELLSRLPGLRRRRSPFSHPLAQVLEARVLPAGNVNVRISNNTVVITGDREDNEVSVIVEDGNLVVRGLDDTTINGEEDDFIVAEDSETFDGKLLVRLGTGNDTFAVDGGPSSAAAGGRVRAVLAPRAGASAPAGPAAPPAALRPSVTLDGGRR